MYLQTYRGDGQVAETYEVIPLTIPDEKPLRQPAHLIIVADCSGSMYGDIAALRAMLHKLVLRQELQNSELRISLISYAGVGDVKIHFAQLPVKEVGRPGSDAARQIADLQTRGLTCISGALRAAMALIRDDELTCLTLHTDGWANDPSPSTERRGLLDLVDGLALRSGVYLSGIAYRSSADHGLLSELAARGKGQAVLARSVESVESVIFDEAERLAGSTCPEILIAAPSGRKILFYSGSGKRCMMGEETLRIPGLTRNDDKQAWMLQPIRMDVDTQEKLARKNAGGHVWNPAPVKDTDNAPLLVRLLLCRAQLAARNITAAKEALRSTRNEYLLRTHARALTPTGLSALADDLDGLLAKPFRSPHATLTPEGITQPMVARRVTSYDGTGEASISQILKVLAQAPSGTLSIHVPDLLSGYVRRGLKRIPGTRQADGSVLPPPVCGVPQYDDGWVFVHSVDASSSAANISIKTATPLQLRVTDPARAGLTTPPGMLHSVAGISLRTLTDFRAYTVVADGEPTVGRLKLRVGHAQTRAELRALNILPSGAEGGILYELSWRDRPLLPAGFEDGLRTMPIFRLQTEAENLLVYTILRRLCEAMLGKDGSSASALSTDQIKQLAAVCVTPKLNFSPPTTTAHPDLEGALARGEVDTRVANKAILTLLGFPLGRDSLYGADEFLARYWNLLSSDAKPRLMDVFRDRHVLADKNAGRLKKDCADALMLPIYEGVIGYSHRAERPNCPIDLKRFSPMVNRIHQALGDAQALSDLLVDIKAHEEIAEDELRPFVWLVASQGCLPSFVPHRTLDGEGVGKLLGSKLPKSAQESTFFVLGGNTQALNTPMVAITPEVQHYTVRMDTEGAE